VVVFGKEIGSKVVAFAFGKEDDELSLIMVCSHAFAGLTIKRALDHDDFASGTRVNLMDLFPLHPLLFAAEASLSGCLTKEVKLCSFSKLPPAEAGLTSALLFTPECSHP
jgi:hypothetical protein